MAYEAGMATPVIMSGNNDGFLGGGGIGSLLIGALLFGGGLGGFGRGAWGNVGGPAASAVATDIVLNPALTGIQNQISNLSNTVNQNEISSQIDVLGSSLNSGLANAQNGIRDNANLYLSQSGQIQTSLASGNFTTLSSINGLGRDITAQNNQNSMLNLNSFNQLTTSMLQGFNEIGKDTANSTNQIIAGQTALAAQMAACCCEIKQAISADGAATRALINDLNVANLTTQLNDAKNQISNLNQTNTIQNALNAQSATIINHLIPRPVV